MNSNLPATGTTELLELLAPFIPDDFINQWWPSRCTGGRRWTYTAAQLYRVHLLSLLSPVHSLNLLVKMLPEQRAWQKFAGLRRQNCVPGVRVLHEFRARVGVAGLRRINQYLLQPLVEPYLWRECSVGLIDATDLPAACVGFKKKHRTILCGSGRSGRSHAQDWAKPMVRGLQETHTAFVVTRLPGRSTLGPVGQLGYSSQCVRRRAAGAQLALLPAAMGLVSAAGRSGHGLFGGGSQTPLPRALARGRPDQTAQRHEIDAALRGLESSRLPAGRTAGLAGLRWPGRRTLVWDGIVPGTVRAMLGSRTLSAPICLPP